MAVGTAVDARFEGGRDWYSAQITRMRNDGTVDLAYDDGDTERRVPRKLVRLQEERPPQAKKDNNNTAQPTPAESASGHTQVFAPALVHPSPTPPAFSSCLLRPSFSV